MMRHTDGDRPNVGALLKAEAPNPQPFDPSGTRFGRAFREVIVRPQFDALRSDAGAPWFTILEPHLPDFWRQVRMRYLELPSS
ncbi:hypothetical protein R1A27_14185 [Methylobacterium sp. NMS12]|uniref:hypothetical protein n=1 Tax=Methylobacterium sp. NMS12 TaxID=3079766 RepID=UPI003F884435